MQSNKKQLNKSVSINLYNFSCRSELTPNKNKSIFKKNLYRKLFQLI